MAMVTIDFDDQRGNHVLASADIPEGTVLISSKKLRSQPNRDKYSVQIGDEHVIIDTPGIYVNHSCTPNCSIRPNAMGAFDFVSTRHIAAGEEIFWDYFHCEDEIATPFVCACATDNCRGLIYKKQLSIQSGGSFVNITLSVVDGGKTILIQDHDAKTRKFISPGAEHGLAANAPATQIARIISVDVSPTGLNLELEDGNQAHIPLEQLVN